MLSRNLPTYLTLMLLTLSLPAASRAVEEDPRSAADVTSPEDGLHVGKLAVNRILFLGNSITLHGPAANIGWEGNWGMAASSEEKDFVHRLLHKIAKAAEAKPEVRVRNIADFERHLSDYNVQKELEKELLMKADVVIVAVGENVAPLSTAERKTAFHLAFRSLLRQLQKQGQPVIFVRSTFWADQEKDEILRKASSELGCNYVDISQLSTDEANFARSERKIKHEGVAAHPGDQGMQAIAELIWTELMKQSQ